MLSIKKAKKPSEGLTFFSPMWYKQAYILLSISQKILFSNCVSFVFGDPDSHNPITRVRLLSGPSAAHGHE